MDIPRAQRDELKALSKEVFGVESRYQKFFETKDLLTRKETQPILDEKGMPLESGATQEVDVPVLNAQGLKQYVVKRRSVEEVLDLLKSFQVKRNEFLAEMNAKKEAAAAKKAEADKVAKLNEQLAGSALT